MVLAELGTRITSALRTMTAHTVIDEEAVDTMLKEIASVRYPALIRAELVHTL
jgi:signal recognition particle GTPase